MHTRRNVILSITLALNLVAATVLVVGGGSASRHRSAASTPLARRRGPATITPRRTQPTPYHPHYINPPQTPVQVRIDQNYAAQVTAAAIAEIDAVNPPSPATSASFPLIGYSSADQEYSFAQSFMAELLDIRFAHQSRPALLAWAMQEAAAQTMPGVTAEAGRKTLYYSLTHAPSPVPSQIAWNRYEAQAVIWQATNISSVVSKQATELIDMGWEPRDPYFTELDVTGDLIVTTAGQTGPPASYQFFARLTIGQALHQPGYGAVVITGWSVTGA